ncbi:MAG: response regulator transcription factor [Lachnospiraceae bacterium]|nr:response regulator transcription factor [Lachnospiraceae bacterium]
MAYKVVVAEDFKMIREVFEHAVEGTEGYELAASFQTALEAARFCEGHPVDLVLMDVLIPGSMSGLEAGRLIKAKHPEIKIIIVTSMPELSYERQAREIGVEGFWRKEVQEQPIAEIMDRVMAGEQVYPQSKLSVQVGNAVSTDFTQKEVQVLKYLVAGLSNQEIAEKMFVTERTVKAYISELLQKTGYRSRLELALKARHLGIIIEDEPGVELYDNFFSARS